MNEVERALEELIEKEDAAEELRQEGKMNKLTNEKDDIGRHQKKSNGKFRGDTEKKE